MDDSFGKAKPIDEVYGDNFFIAPNQRVALSGGSHCFSVKFTYVAIYYIILSDEKNYVFFGIFPKENKKNEHKKNNIAEASGEPDNVTIDALDWSKEDKV